MTYLEYYDCFIAPKLQDIDLFIKTEEDYDIKKMANLLHISVNEVKDIIYQNDISEINKITFFDIMLRGSSEICKLFNRELERSNFINYSIDDISYIYDLTEEQICDAKCKSCIDTITSENIRILFSNLVL